MKIKTTPNFDKQTKKLHKNQTEDLEKSIKIIFSNPDIGEEKLGDLNNVRVYKFKSLGQLILLAYIVIDDDILLLSYGSHQNFYENLKRYIRNK